MKNIVSRNNTNQNTDVFVNKKISNILITQYKKGLAIKNQELVSESQPEGFNEDADIVTPSTGLQVPKSTIKSTNAVRTVPNMTKGYKVPTLDKAKLQGDQNKVKEFIIQSRVLENELDHVLGVLKLNNTGEFYGGAILTDAEKEQLESEDDIDELNKTLEQIYTEIEEKEARGEDCTELYNDYMFLEYLIKKHEHPLDIIEEYGRYQNLDPYQQQLVLEVLKNGKKYKGEGYEPDVVDLLQRLGYDINRQRSDGAGKSGNLNQVTLENVTDSYTLKNQHIKAKHGIRVLGEIKAKDFPSDLLLIIKKISNHIISNLIPLIQTLNKSHFQGMVAQDKITITELYGDIDDKMYILTTMNNTSNDPLIRLDKDFDKLYNLVKHGLDSYVPSTMSGGSMMSFLGISKKGYSGNMYTNYKTDQLYLL